MCQVFRQNTVNDIKMGRWALVASSIEWSGGAVCWLVGNTPGLRLIVPYVLAKANVFVMADIAALPAEAGTTKRCL